MAGAALALACAAGCGSSQNGASSEPEASEVEASESPAGVAAATRTERWQGRDSAYSMTTHGSVRGEADFWQLTEDTEFNARITIANRSALVIERVWMRPGEETVETVGYVWREGESLQPGQSLSGRAVEGVWDVTFTTESGETATLNDVEFPPSELTRVAIDDDWWGRSDLQAEDEVFTIR